MFQKNKTQETTENGRIEVIKTVLKGYRYGYTADVIGKCSHMCCQAGGIYEALGHFLAVERPARKSAVNMVHIHNPAELPVMSSGYLRVSPNKEVTLAIEPEKISISDELKHFPMWRMCSLQNEEQLDYFNHWTQKNCFLECLSKFTYEECHCVPYYMPAGSQYDEKEIVAWVRHGTKICSGNKKRCYLDAEEEWSRKSMDRHVLHGYDWECGCSPDCSKDVYKYQYSTSEFNWQAVLRAYGEDLKHFQGRSMSRVTVYIADILNVDNHVESFTSAPFDTWGNLTVIVTGLTFILLTVLFFIISVEQSTLQSESSYKEPLMNINMS
ncbi:hypothetical protein AAG570_003632 [Ranatra chinensis]|uniref:Uncharacterized protein n=1 Tax=Ranatra chinensis TaxID=642074 RepID=A0ABD0YIM5_9HEMI